MIENEMSDIFSGWDDTGSNMFADPKEEESTKIDQKIGIEKVDKKETDEVGEIGEVKSKPLFEESVEGDDELKPKEVLNTEDVSTNMGTLNFLKNKGLIDFEVEEGVTLSEIEAEALLEESYEESFDKRFDEFYKDLPEEVKELNKFVYGGGNVKDYISKVYTNQENSSLGSLDLGNESNQMLIAERSLSDEGYDEDYIKAHIDFLKDSGRLKTYTEKKQESYKKIEIQNREQVFKQQEERLKAEKETLRQMKSSVFDTVSKEEDLNGFKLSPKDKKELPSYIVDRSIKLENGGTISAFQKDLLESLKDSKKITVLAKVLRNNFDFSEIAKNTTTKNTRKVKNDLQRSQKTGVKEPRSPKLLSDWF